MYCLQPHRLLAPKFSGLKPSPPCERQRQTMSGDVRQSSSQHRGGRKMEFLVETLPNVGTVQVYVRPAHSAPEQGMRVSVSDKAVTVDAGDGQPPMEISLPCAVDLKSVRSRPAGSDGFVTLTLAAKDRSQLRVEDDPHSDIDRLRSCGDPKLVCVKCGAALTRPGAEFRRVLPLPSSTWHEMMDFWICHKERFPQYQPHGPLLAREGLLLVGPTHYLVHAHDANTDNLVDAAEQAPAASEGETSPLSCGQCGAAVGARSRGAKARVKRAGHDTESSKGSCCGADAHDGHGAHEHPHAADSDTKQTQEARELQPSGGHAANATCSSSSASDTAALVDANEGEATDSASDLPEALAELGLGSGAGWASPPPVQYLFYKYYATYPGDPFAAVSMAHRVAVYVAHTLMAVSQSEISYRLWICEGTEAAAARVLQVWLLNWRTYINASAADSQGYVPCLKVLYNDCRAADEESKRAADAWVKDDDNVHTLAFPREVCDFFAQTLAGSNLYPPPAMRTMRGFCVGYLPLA